VRGIEGSDMGSDPFERTPLINVWLWMSDLVLDPSSQRKGEHLNHHGRLACTLSIRIALESLEYCLCRLAYIQSLVVSSFTVDGVDDATGSVSFCSFLIIRTEV
jgi:hypothetical protein